MHHKNDSCDAKVSEFTLQNCQQLMISETAMPSLGWCDCKKVNRHY